MMVDTNIYGYTVDGGAYHPACTEARPDGDRADVGALFSIHDEDPHGLTCDACYAYIFEPVEQHDPNPDGTCDWGCFGYCGDTESCHLHGGEAPERPNIPPPSTLRVFEAQPMTRETFEALWGEED